MFAKKAGIGLTLVAGAWLAALAVVPAAAQTNSNAMQQVGMVRTGTGTFSLDVEGADLRTVLKAISEFSGRNIVMGSSVRATVKISIRNVAWQDALKAVLRSAGLDFVEDGAIIRVDEAAKLNTEKVEREAANARTMELLPLETRIIKLNYANAGEMGQPLSPALSKRGSIQVEKRTNSLVVTDLPQNLETVTRMATDLDAATPQVEITAKLVDVDVSALRGIGIEWNVGPTVGPDAEFFSSTGPNPPDYLHPGNDNENALGGEHNSGISDPATRITYGISKDWGFVEAQLQMLEENRKANIISNPRITTVDNREAKIIVGQKIPLIVQDVAGNPVSQLQTIGIQLRVTPHLTQDKRIIMDLHPEVSDLSTQSTVQGGIIINTSEADTRVMVDDGQTAVIGGLIRTNESTVVRGVPLLKDVPLLGLLFSSHSTIRQNRELIIFVTPRLINQMASN
jgi:type IV pilus assembly protein PilQ